MTPIQFIVTGEVIKFLYCDKKEVKNLSLQCYNDDWSEPVGTPVSVRLTDSRDDGLNWYCSATARSKNVEVTVNEDTFRIVTDFNLKRGEDIKGAPAGNFIALSDKSQLPRGRDALAYNAKRVDDPGMGDYAKAFSKHNPPVYSKGEILREDNRITIKSIEFSSALLTNREEGSYSVRQNAASAYLVRPIPPELVSTIGQVANKRSDYETDYLVDN